MYKEEKNRLFELPSEDLWEKGVDIIYVASQTCQISELVKLDGYVHYEERPLLSVILRLKDPNIRCAYFSSVKIPDVTLDYYFNLAVGNSNDPSLLSSLRERFFYRYFGEETPEPLTSKILNSPKIIKEVKEWMREKQSFMYCIIPTEIENELSDILNSPLLANPYQLNHLGTKFGSRAIFDKANIPFPDGIEEEFTLEGLINGLNKLWKKYPKHNKIVVKLNEGVSGVGNTIFNLSKLERNFVEYSTKYQQQKREKNEVKNDFKEEFFDDHLEEYRKKLIKEELENGMDFVDETESWANFYEKIGEKGAIAELWIDHVEGLTSPSAQAEILSFSKKVFCLSTHEQMLWKNSKYLGCSFPANSSYHLKIQEYCKRVGEVLAEEGAKERFAVDFVVVPRKNHFSNDNNQNILNENLQVQNFGAKKNGENGNGNLDKNGNIECRQNDENSHQNCTENSGEKSGKNEGKEEGESDNNNNGEENFDIFAIEINLRTGGTTHPYETVKLLIDGYYNSNDGFLYTPSNERRCYKASDNIINENYRKLTISELLSLLSNSIYAWNDKEKKGGIFYITGSLIDYGKVGFVAVGESVDEADRYFNGFIHLLNQTTGVHC